MLFFSAGAVLLAYVILWIVVPPARMATEKTTNERSAGYA